jgi:hypothetical protein
MAEKEQQVTVKEDGADVHYHLDAKSRQAAEKIVAAVQTRRAERVAREGGADAMPAKHHCRRLSGR